MAFFQTTNGLVSRLLLGSICLLHCRGCEEVLRKRLKSHLRRQLIQSDPAPPSDVLSLTVLNPYGLDYLLVLDFEATCLEKNPPDYIHEIIEFPVLLLNLQTLHVVGFDARFPLIKS